MIDILLEASNIVNGSRQDQYGDPERNHDTIAAIWTILLRRAGILPPDIAITGQHVCLLMVGMKLARLANTLDHRDSQIDIAGYIALLSIIQQESHD